MFAFVFVALAAALAPQESSAFAIQAKHLHVGDGRVIDNGVLLVQDGVIRSVGSASELPAGVPVIQHSGAISPGFVSAHDQLALGAEGFDDTRAMLPGALVADAFDPQAKQLKSALSTGITTVLLAPSSASLVGGQTAVVKTSGGRVLARRSHLALSLASEALSVNTPPTSPMGALVILETELAANVGAFGEVKAGRLPVMIHAVERHEVLRSVEFATRNGLKGSIEGAPLAGELAETIKLSGLSVVLQPFSGGEAPRELRAALALSTAGVPFAFGLDTPNIGPTSLRLSAAMCLREQMDRKQLERALFFDAATICGVADRVGRLERGLDADFLLWSGDPLSLSSQLQAVYVDGARVDTH
jgi:imidazolonepropionase-like amidohydrolase